MIHHYGAALIEEFIEGTECTVLVAENPDDPAHPTTYQPIQYRFPEGESFKHYNLKWVNYDGLEAFPVEDPAMDALLREAASRFFLGMRGVELRTLRREGRCRRAGLHAGDQSQLRALLSADGCRAAQI